MSKKVIAIAVAILVCGALVPNLNAQWNQLLDEDFESAWSTTSPPAGWTINYTGSVGNSDWHRRSYSGSATACIYWSPSETGVDELISPVLDCSGCDEVWIAANHYYNHFGGPYTAQWLGSTDGGSTFPNVIVDYGGSTYPWTRDSIDISSWAAGESQVVINFYGDGNTYNMNYWYVDNVAVWAHSGGVSPPFVDTLFCEYFEGSWLPPGWSQIITNTGQTYPGMYATWYHGNYDALFHHGSWGAYIWWSPNYQNEWLITPQIDLTGYNPQDSVDLRFSSAFYQNWPSGWTGGNFIKVSTDGGESWDEIVDLVTEFGGSGWTYINDYPNPLEFRISEYIGQTILIAFHYLSGSNGGYSVWSVDDVCLIVSGGGGGGPGADSLDLAIEGIIRPKTFEEPFVPFTPEILVINNLDTTAHALMRCKIKDRMTAEQVYEDVLSVVPVEPGENFIDGFADFTPESGKKYNALFVLEHPDDVNDANNHKDKDFEALVGMEVTPFEIVLPEDQQEGPFSPTARYAEEAGADTTEANLIYTIEDMALQAIVVSDTMAHTFMANDTFTATFSRPDLEGGTYTITYWAEDPTTGSNISSPPISKTFEFTPGIAETPVPLFTSLEVVGHTVNFSLANATNVSIRVYDVAGKLVAKLVEGSRDAGYYNVQWNTAGVASGVYFVKMLTPGFSASDKIVVLY